jgi:hypothetical protein
MRIGSETLLKIKVSTIKERVAIARIPPRYSHNNCQVPGTRYGTERYPYLLKNCRGSGTFSLGGTGIGSGSEKNGMTEVLTDTIKKLCN